MGKIFRMTVPKGSSVKAPAPAAGIELAGTAEQAYLWARELNDTGRPEEAIPLLRTALALDATHQAAGVELGTTLQDVGRAREASEAFEAYLSRHPDGQQVRLAFAGCLVRQARLELAVDQYLMCLDGDPSWDAPYMPLVSALCRLGRLGEAGAQLKAFRGLNPDSRSVEMLARLIDRKPGPRA